MLERVVEIVLERVVERVVERERRRDLATHVLQTKLLFMLTVTDHCRRDSGDGRVEVNSLLRYVYIDISTYTHTVVIQ